MDKFVTLSTGPPLRTPPHNPPVSEKKPQDPIRGLHYDLEMLINDKKFKPAQIEELSDQISQGSQSSNRKTRDNRASSRTPERSERSELSHKRNDSVNEPSQSGRSDLAHRKNGDGFSEDELNNLINNYQKPAGQSNGRNSGLSEARRLTEKRPNVIEIPTSPRAQLKAKLDDLIISDSEDEAEESDRYQEKRYNRKHESRDYNQIDDRSETSYVARPSDPSHYGNGSAGAYGNGSAGAYGNGSAGAYGNGSAGAYGNGSAGAYGNQHNYNGHDEDDESDNAVHYSSKLKQPTEKPDEDEDSEEHLSHRQIQTRKQQLMIRSARLKKQGYPPASNLNMTMSLQEMKEIVDIQKEERSLENAIRLQGDVLTGIVTGVEKLNTKFDPADIHLEGWSESFYENLDNYDEVFEDLYYKYSEKVHVEPEIKLIGMVFGSGMAFHFSKSVMDKAGESIPGFQDVMAKRPDLARAYQEEALNMMSQPSGMPPFHPYMARGQPRGPPMNQGPPMTQGPPRGPPMNQGPPRGPPMNQGPAFQASQNELRRSGPPMNQGPPRGPPMNQGPAFQASQNELRRSGPPMNQMARGPHGPVGQPSEPVGMSPAGMGAPAHAGNRSPPGPPPIQTGGGMNQMGNLLNNLTGGNPFLGNLLNNIMSNQGGGGDSDDDEFSNSANVEPAISQNRSDFRQRRLSKKQTKSAKPSDKYAKVFQGPASQKEIRKSSNNSSAGMQSGPPENILNDIDDVDDLLSGILPPMPENQTSLHLPESDFVRKTRRNRTIAV